MQLWESFGRFLGAAVYYWFAFAVLLLLDAIDFWNKHGKKWVRSVTPEKISSSERFRRLLDGRRTRWSRAMARVFLLLVLFLGSFAAYNDVWQENERLKAATSPRPHISLVMENTLIDVERNTLFVEAVNIGERTASEVWIMFRPPLATTAIPPAWMVYDLGPGEKTQAALMLVSMTEAGGSPQFPKQWHNNDGKFMTAVSACYRFADRWFSTPKYTFFCDSTQTVCNDYQQLPPDSCPQRKDVAMYLYKQTSGPHQ